MTRRKGFLYFTLPDGSEIGRKTDNDYAFALVCPDEEKPRSFTTKDKPGEWRIVSCSKSRQPLEAKRHRHSVGWLIIPVAGRQEDQEPDVDEIQAAANALGFDLEDPMTKADRQLQEAADELGIDLATAADEQIQRELETPEFAAALAHNDLVLQASAQVHEEVASLLLEQKQTDILATSLQAAISKADAADDTATAEKLHPRLIKALNAGTTISEKISTLREPAEIVRRVQDRLARNQQRQRLDALAEGSTGMAKDKTPKTAKESAKDQGVPEVYLGETGNFKPGLDARYKSDLILSIVGATKAEAKKMLHTFTKTDAEQRLAQRNWTHYLERKIQILEDKASKAAQKTADTKAKIEAKKNGAGETSPEMKEKLKAAGEVVPDPKPAKKQKAGRK